jgi:cytochrome c peroxidase
VAVLATGAGLSGCGASGARSLEIPVPLGLELYAPVPDDNGPTREREELGRRLFEDPLLSADRTIACASCHRSGDAFADDTAVSRGVFGRTGHRNTPSLLNIAYARHLTWDGRSSTLEEQVLKPIQDPVEMDLSLDELMARLQSDADYREAFTSTFGAPASSNAVALALAAYLRTLRSGNAPIDRLIAGQGDALSREARAGFRVFAGKARCSFCHLGPLFTDSEFHNTGVTARSGSADQGRFARTGIGAERRAFRTASLRNVGVTAPYMHDGSFVTLDEVVDFYDRGGGPDPLLDVRIRPLQLSQEEKRSLVAFLRSLGSG